MPNACTVAFLKDNSYARMGNFAVYTETAYPRYNIGFVRFDHAGGCVAKSEIYGVEPDRNGQYTIDRQWASGDKTTSHSESIDLSGNGKNVHLRAWAVTGLVWDPWDAILNIAIDDPDAKTWRLTGITLDRSQVRSLAGSSSLATALAWSRSCDTRSAGARY